MAAMPKGLTPPVYLDEHGFLLGTKQTAHDADREHRRLDKWLKMLATWDSGGGEYAKVKRRVRAGGIPDPVRGLAWQALLGARELLHEHAGLYQQLMVQDMEPALREIALADLSRTLPTHCMFFQDMGVGQQSLLRVVTAYAVYDPRVGYCQGMGFIVATLLTQMAEEEAFWCFVVMMRHPKYLLGDLYLQGFPRLQEFFGILQLLLERHCPKLASHLQEQGIQMSFFATQWFMTLFVYIRPPFPLLLYIWDLFMVEGWKVVFRIALALLLLEEDHLLSLPMEHLYVKLKGLHEDKDLALIVKRACALKVTNRELELLARCLKAEAEKAE
eukprot:TRINITY_DN16302_c0_g1_i1.p1 TRINITY_DN16302_c0_g1~~TRINITY_DN16302_c0_g1_i1.p1  ORF type:complete len:330 (+),score=124.01 TRINITY_DN16302_c0_g1_i1:139-1128(+)